MGDCKISLIPLLEYNTCTASTKNLQTNTETDFSDLVLMWCLSCEPATSVFKWMKIKCKLNYLKYFISENKYKLDHHLINFQET